MYTTGALMILLTPLMAMPVEQLAGSNNRIDESLSIQNGAYFRQQGESYNGAEQTTQGVNVIVALFTPRPKGREEAFSENPIPLVQKETIYDYAQQFVANILNPKPIVDSIQEHEKYGNSGDQFRSFGNVLVGGYEGFSNFLNAASDFPFEAMKKATRKASSYLSSLGAKIVGL